MDAPLRLQQRLRRLWRLLRRRRLGWSRATHPAQGQPEGRARGARGGGGGGGRQGKGHLCWQGHCRRGGLGPTPLIPYGPRTVQPFHAALEQEKGHMSTAGLAVVPPMCLALGPPNLKVHHRPATSAHVSETDTCLPYQQNTPNTNVLDHLVPDERTALSGKPPSETRRKQQRASGGERLHLHLCGIGAINTPGSQPGCLRRKWDLRFSLRLEECEHTGQR